MVTLYSKGFKAGRAIPHNTICTPSKRFERVIPHVDNKLGKVDQERVGLEQKAKSLDSSKHAQINFRCLGFWLLLSF